MKKRVVLKTEVKEMARRRDQIQRGQIRVGYVPRKAQPKWRSL